MDQVHGKLDEIARLVETARAMPMSASCVVNRGELLGLLDDLRALLPDELLQAQRVLAERQVVVEGGRQEAERLVAEAQQERDRLLAQSTVVQEAQAEAARVVDEAYDQAEAMRREVEDYVDTKLANFEIVLTRTLRAVERGRQRLAGRTEMDELSDDEPLPG